MFAVVQVFDFRLQAALRLEKGLGRKAVVLVDAGAAQPRVEAMTDAAEAEGVVVGMSVAQAMSRCGELEVRYRSASAEALAGRALFDAAYGISPRVEETDEGICTIDLQGVDERTLREQLLALLARLQKCDLKGRIGMADTPDLAWLRAKWVGGPCLHASLATTQDFAVDGYGGFASHPASPEGYAATSEYEDDDGLVGEAKGAYGEEALRRSQRLLPTFLEWLPVRELEVSEALAGILELWGIRFAAGFARLSRQAVSDRLGDEGVRLWDRLMGKTVRPLRCSEPGEIFEESLDFEYDLASLEPILFVGRRFLDQLELRLRVKHLEADVMRFEMTLDYGEPIRLKMKVPDPTASADVLFRMLSARMEKVTAESAVVALRLRIDPVERSERQLGLFETALKNPHRFSQTLARVAGIVGEDKVGMPVLAADGRPDGFELERLPPTVAPLGMESGLGEQYGFALKRYRPALKAEVELRGKEPVWFRCKVAQGFIAQYRGPWTHSGHWWEEGAWNRVEWDVELRKGGLYRIVWIRGEWFVEGCYD